MKPLFLTYRFFQLMGLVILLMAFSFLWAWLFYVGLVLLVAIILVGGYEYFRLRQIASDITAKRIVDEQFSLGDFQSIFYVLENHSDHEVEVQVFDELPFQFQQRAAIQELRLKADSRIDFAYNVRPVSRGAYHFGRMHLLLTFSKIGIIQYSVTREEPMLTKVYPSVLQMKKYALQMTSRTATMFGIRKVRTIGENDEFEHIRQYQQGDNIKSINWKATSRQGELLVNQYQDSRSQMVYCVLDKGRSMEMPFNGLSLLDYSINSALVLSNIVLNKYDKSGLITFSKHIDTFLPAEAQRHQLDKILNLLYNQKTTFQESGFEQLYYHFRHKVTRRSIVFLFTNFESIHDLHRNIKYLKALAHRHLLIVISFENAQLLALQEQAVKTVSDIYDQTIATSFIYEKKKIIAELKHHGIQAIYTKPEELSINLINKYLELKSKRMK